MKAVSFRFRSGVSSPGYYDFADSCALTLVGSPIDSPVAWQYNPAMMDREELEAQRLPRGSDALWPLGWRLAAIALLVIVLAAPLLIWREPIGALFAQRELVIARIRAAGAWGPLVLMGLAVAQTIAAPIPGQVVNFAAGRLYGFTLGIFYSWLAAMVGSTAAMGLARVAGRPLVERLLGSGLLARLDALATGKGLPFFFLVFLIPGLPDDAVCFLAGLTRLPLPALILAAAIGRMPGLAAAVWAGAHAGGWDWRGWVLAGLAALGAAGLAWRYGRGAQERLLRWIARNT